ncbi:hypothetical protein [Actinoplanes sp. NPDC049118]|uniref:hypothetical protein n=1 Tax=Actinoplanes sp. NPDC049118 TaxID=3155769 RepID=UPI0033D76FA8
MAIGQDAQPLAHCVVANVAEETAQGPGGLEIRAGTRHFAPGAKVWVLPARWSSCEDKLFVVGRHRSSAHRSIRIALPRRHLTRFRVRTIYSPAVLRAILRPGRKDTLTPRLWTDLAEAREAAARWNEPTLTAYFDDTTNSTTVEDPPPAVLDYRGRTYHLAHFNAYRARYSAQPPPVEPHPGAG